MAEDIAQILRDFPAIDPHTAVIAVDPGFYCIIPDETRAEAASEIGRLRAALKPFADVGRKLRDARVCETGAIPAGASARFLKLEPLIAGDFVQAADAFDNEQSGDSK